MSEFTRSDTQQPAISTAMNDSNQEFWLSDFLVLSLKLWRRIKAHSRSILIATLSGALIGLGLGFFFLQKSKVEGIYQLVGPIYLRGGQIEAMSFGSLNLAQFKALQALAADRSRLREYFSALKIEGAADEVNLENILGDPERQSQVLEIQYGASKADAKALADPAALKDQAATVLGIRIKSEHRSSEVANNNVQAIGAFLTDTLFKHEITNYSIARAEEFRRAKLSTERQVLETGIALKFNSERIRELRQIAIRSGEATRGTPATVVSLSKEMVPYLPLPTQIAAIEVSNMESNLTLKQLELQANYDKYKQAYYEAVHQFAEKTLLGAEIVKQLPKIKAEIDQKFANIAQEIKPASLSIDLEIASIEDAFKRRNRFLAPPATVNRGVILTLILTILMAIFFTMIAIIWTYVADSMRSIVDAGHNQS